MTFTLNAAWLEAVMLGGVRVAAFVVIAPPFSHGGIPVRIKGMIAVLLAVAISPRITPGYVQLDTAGFLGALVLEVLVGAVLGFLVMLVFAAVQAAGNLLDLFGGFQIAQAFDPQLMINGAQFTRLFGFLTTVLLFASDGYQVILLGFTRSFEVVPLGGGMDLSDPAALAVTGLTSMFLSAIQIAGPLLIVLVLADVGLGLLTRVAPALNAFVLGFPLKILITITLSPVIVLALPRVVSGLTGEAVSLMGVR